MAELIISRPLTSSDVVTVVQGSAGASAWPVSATSLPLPTGAATSAAQTTGNSSLSSIDTKTPALGQALMAASVPVAIASNQGAVPVSASSLPLPTGAATETTLGTRLADATFTGRINTLGQKTSANSTPVVLASDQSSVPVTGTFWQATQPVSAASLPLPTGAATAANQTTLGSSTTKLNDGTNTAAVKAASTAALATDPALVVAISPNNTPVLPSGAATAANQTTGNASLSSIDGKIPSIGQKTGANSIPVVIASDQSLTIGSGIADKTAFTYGTTADQPMGGVYQDTSPTVTAGQSGALRMTAYRGLHTNLRDSSGNEMLGQKLSAASIPVVMASDQSLSISSGLADKTTFTYGTTSEQPFGGVYQDTAPTVTAGQTGAVRITAYRGVHSNLRDSSGNELLGSKVSASSVPVVIASDQGAVPVSGTFWQATQPVSGTVTANIGTSGSLALDATLTGGTQRSKVTDGTNNAAVKAASTAAAATDPALVVAVSPNNSVAVTGTFWQSTQPVSAASLPLPTGAATAAKQPALGTAGAASADVITVQGIASMTALKVDGSAVTQPVSAASLPLPTGAATAAKQPALGTAGTASSDVITVQGIASMTALKVDGSAVTQPVSAASLPLPTGAATSANQTTANASLSSIDGKLASLGQKTMSGSTPVTIASDQGAITVTLPADVTPATVNVTTADIASSTASGASSQSIVTGTPTAGSAAAFSLSSWETAAIQVSGTWTGTLQVEVSTDGGTTYYPRPGYISGTTAQSATFTANVLVHVNVAGCTHVRIRATAAMTGTATVRCAESDSTSIAFIANTVAVSAASLPLPSGAATSALQSTISGQLPASLGSKTSANSMAVVIASDQAAVAVSAASLPLPSGAATSANQTTLGSQTTKINDGTNTAAVKAASTAAVATDAALVVAVSPNNTVPVSAASLPLPSGAATAANQTTLGSQTTKLNDGTNTAAVKAASTAAAAADPALVVSVSPNTPAKLWDGTNTAAVKGSGVSPATTDSALVVAISPNNTAPTVCGTATLTNYTITAASATAIASNAARKGLICFNDSTAVIYINYGGTASSTAFTYKLGVGQTWEMTNYIYTGAINVIGTASSGTARFTELT